MVIESLELQNFRNYRSLTMALHGGNTIIYGDNAQGKTNILEAVYLCATSKSHKTGKDKDMILFGEEEAHIKMLLRKRQVPYRIDIHLKKNKKKGIAINGVPIKKVTELPGLLNVVFFSPEDLSIVKNSPAERRRFLDLELCQLDKIYMYHLSNYNKVIFQRNKLLKDIKFRSDLTSLLDAWDEQLIAYGREVIRARKNFIEELEPIVERIHGEITGKKEKLKIIYEPDCSQELLERAVKEKRLEDIKTGSSGAGPHRDDMAFLVNDIDVRRYGSQGQQRTAALSLKMAEIELVKKITKDKPILLLDDVLSELDAGRQTNLLKFSEETQTLLTCTGLDDFIKTRFHIDQSICIKNGSIDEGKNIVSGGNYG